MITSSEFLLISDEVKQALASNIPVVALESAVISHGLPYPENIQTAIELENILRSIGCVPATIAVLNGTLKVGLHNDDIERLSNSGDLIKISTRDISTAIMKNLCGGTTVAATMYAAHGVGIQVFATGGIGGVHRGEPFDISADIIQLSRTPLIVVCAGPKVILDLHATSELLETLSVPVIGYQCAELPAFYSRSSGLKVFLRLENVEEIVDFYKIHISLGHRSAILVTNPLPSNEALPFDDVEGALITALEEAKMQGLQGKDVTPFLLKSLAEQTAGTSLKANLALLRENTRLAGLISKEISGLSN